MSVDYAFEYEPPEREHTDCGWCDSGSCREGSKCGLAPVDTYPGDDYDPLTPDLTPAERAVVQRFENAPDPYAGDCTEPACDGELHYTGAKDPVTNEDVEAGACPQAGAR